MYDILSLITNHCCGFLYVIVDCIAQSLHNDTDVDEQATCKTDMEELGLNEQHKTLIVQYLRFARYQRAQRLRAIDACFTDLKESRLEADSTFTQDEIKDMLNGLLIVVKGEAEAEFINSAHSNVLLLRQMCAQAEHWHLKLNADISDLENRELLEALKNFEEEQFSLKKDKQGLKLEPIGGGGASPLLKAEIGRLAEENMRLQSSLRSTELQATKFIQDKERLAAQLQNAQSQLGSAPNENAIKAANENVDMLQAEMNKLKTVMQNDLAASQNTQQLLENDLTSAKHRLLEIQEQLEMKEKELEKKFSQTNVYQNMKKMLNKKNDQIKKLRGHLDKYEPNVTFDED